MSSENRNKAAPGDVKTIRGTRWWVLHVGLSIAAVFFMLFGIHLLVAAYNLEDPFHFIMTFFSSNLIILISGALLFGFCCRIIAALKSGDDRSDP